MTTAVITNPYLRPVNEYAIARIMGAYMPYDLLPNRYLAMLTIVASIAIAMSNSSICSDIPLLNSQFVNGEYCIYIPLTI